MLRTLCLLIALGLIAAIVWAIGAADFWVSFDRITADPWGLVTLFDLYAGLVLMGLVVWAVEGRRPLALLWLLASFVLGNVAYALWMAWRGVKLLAAR